MDFQDILSLLFILAGAVMLVISQVLKHKGMWNLRDDSKPFAFHRGFDTPYQVTDAGVMLICMGIVSAIGFNFGFKAGGWALTAVSAALLIFNVLVRLKHVDRDDKDAYTVVVVSNIISVCALALGIFIVAVA